MALHSTSDLDLMPARLSCLLRASARRDRLGLSSVAALDGLVAEVHATRRGDLYDVVYDIVSDDGRHVEVVHTDVPDVQVHSSVRLAVAIQALTHARPVSHTVAA